MAQFEFDEEMLENLMDADLIKSYINYIQRRHR